MRTKTKEELISEGFEERKSSMGYYYMSHSKHPSVRQAFLGRKINIERPTNLQSAYVYISFLDSGEYCYLLPKMFIYDFRLSVIDELEELLDD